MLNIISKMTIFDFALVPILAPEKYDEIVDFFPT